MEQNIRIVPKQLADFFAAHNAAYAAIPTDRLVFDDCFFDVCRQNTCGMYNRCWTCPPGLGSPEALRSRLTAYDTVVVFSVVYPVEDAFDLPGMLLAGRRHNAFSLDVQRLARRILPDSLTTAAGACTLCERCTRPDNRPCRHPDEAMLSLEAYGVDVLKLANAANLPYRTGSQSCAYFSAVLYRQSDISSDVSR